MHIMIALVLALLAAVPAAADIYKYRTIDGRLVIGNRPPPDDATDIRSRAESRAPLVSGTGPMGLADAVPSGQDRPALAYVDHNPLVIVRHDVHSSDVWWKKHVVVWIENRSGRTTASSVRVDTGCFDETGALIDTVFDLLDAIAPRSTRAARGTLVILADDPPARIRCESSVTWRNAM